MKLQVNDKLERFLRVHKPLKIIIGGRGSGKSIGVADCMVFKMLTDGVSIMCLREFQDSVDDSVHNELKDSIVERIGLEGWDLQATKIVAPNGARTTYKGARRNPDSVKSVKGYPISWFEEAQTASAESLDKLIPTIIRTEGAECWFTANPEASGDPFSQRFIVPFQRELDANGYYEDDLHMILVLNWRDNPWWNDAQEKIRQHDFNTMPRTKYDWVWEGKFNDSVDGSIILPEWFDAAKDAHKLPHLKAMFEPQGAKIAAHDPFDDGGDAAGFAIRHGSIITEVHTKETGEIDAVCSWATKLSRDHNVDWFVWDGDGMGTGLKFQVSEAFKGTHTKYHMFKGSLSGKGQDNAELPYMPVDGDRDSDSKVKTYADTFKNNRAQYYIELARRFKNTYNCVIKGKYVDPAEMISLNVDGIGDIVSLRTQLCRIPRKPNAQGLEQIMSKEDMKKLKIASPNEADAVMMTMYNPPAQSAPIKINFSGW
ncbi:MAG: PBSX family phage terminase large subunit [Thalassobium sp.]|nr:MAG: PBSX family phage terminase large subunit [Thalassobium sp.]